MYRLTKRAAARRAWKPEIPAGDARPELWQPPELRRRITIEDFDCGTPRIVVIELHRTRRIDAYAVVVDGKPWRKMGWARVLDCARRAFPRVASPSKIALG